MIRTQVATTSSFGCESCSIFVGSLPLPTVTSKTTILGICLYQPCILDAKGMGQIFVVGISGYLTIKNLELTGGHCSEGSAVLVSGGGPNTEGITGGKLLALNILFSNNTATVCNSSEFEHPISLSNTGVWFINVCRIQGVLFIFYSFQKVKQKAV